MTTCSQPGCGGTIQDGYCDTCGLAFAPSGPSAPSGSTQSTSGATSGRSRSRSRGRGSSRSARGRLGAGLVEIPPVPYRDPAGAVLANPQVPAPDNLRQADGRLGQLVVDDVRRQQLTVEILRAALDWCATGQPAGNGPIWAASRTRGRFVSGSSGATARWPG